MTKIYTTLRLAQKVAWEGGITDALDHGIDADDIAARRRSSTATPAQPGLGV